MGIVAVRTPGPVVVVIDPAAIMIRRPAPRFVADPGPSVRLTPDPGAKTIRRPVVVVIDDCYVRSPDPAVVVDVSPTAVSIEIFRTPNVGVIVAGTLLIFETRGEKMLAI